MFKKAIFGFDSAWTDNPNQPGAIAALVNNKDGWSFIPPRLANFADTESFIRGHSAELQIIALDQPTIVINETGMRPFERVVGSIVNKLGGGVQPANRSKTTMFGNGAPVWRFINQLRPIQNPFLARSAQNGCYLLEVFPALALPILIPTIWNCKRAAKYNPTVTANFSLEDWRLISMGLAEIATSENLESLVTLLRSTANLVSPKKAEQDCIDSVICTLIGYLWLKYGTDRNCVMGDGQTGFMVTRANLEIRSILTQSAIDKGVTVDTELAFSNDFIQQQSQPNVKPCVKKSVLVNSSPKSVTPESLAQSIAFNYQAVYHMLLEAAGDQRILNYGEVLTPFGIKANSFSVVGRLIPILNKIGEENKNRGEPLLPALVVAKTTGYPGDGFYNLLGKLPQTVVAKRNLLVVNKKKFLITCGKIATKKWRYLYKLDCQ